MTEDSNLPAQEEKRKEPVRMMSRRNLLALFGAAGVATVSGGFIKLAHANSVTGSVYDPAQGPSMGSLKITPNELMKLEFCIATTITELRENRQPLLSHVYYIKDEGQEGLFVYNPTDTISNDNTGTVLVSDSGARFKRIVENGHINVKWFGAKGDGKKDDTDAFQAALAYGGVEVKTTVVVPSGDYLLSRELVIISNTDFILAKNSRLIRGHKGNILRNYDIRHATAGGYTGNSHITIIGGIFDCNAMQFPFVCNGISLAHGEDLTLRDVTIKDTYDGHALELSGVMDVVVEHCKFIGYRTEKKELYYVEAIQIEHTGRGFSGWIADNTATQNVIVRNCFFGASGMEGTIPWQAGVASHGTAYKVWADNIQIQNCFFDKQTYWGVRPFRWRRSTISHNIFTEGGGVYITMPGFGSKSSEDINGVPQPVDPTTDITVQNNYFYNLTKYAVYCDGQSDVHTQRIEVKDNIIETVNNYSAIQMINTDYCLITGNIIDGVKKGHGIKLDVGNSYVIDNNTIANVKYNSIIVSSANASRITHNNISNSGSYGLNLFKNKDLDILNNHMDDVSQEGSYSGITLADSSDIRLVGNKVRTSSDAKKPAHGLLVNNTVSGLVRYGNDFRCNAVISNMSDSSTDPVTAPGDLS
jgi:hypothetical protein